MALPTDAQLRAAASGKSEDMFNTLKEMRDLIAAMQVQVNNLRAKQAAFVPAGGTTGQSLKKASNADYDTTWA